MSDFDVLLEMITLTVTYVFVDFAEMIRTFHKSKMLV